MFETDKNKLKFCALSLVLDVVGRMRENINFDVYEKEWQGQVRKVRKKMVRKIEEKIECI